MGTMAKYKTGDGVIHLIASTAYGTCTTAAATAAKVATIQDSQAFTLFTGVTVHIKFTYINSAANPTLNVNNTGAKPLVRYGTTVTGTSDTQSWYAGSIVSFTYDGTSWIQNDYKYNTNTTYSALSQSEAWTGTATTSRVITAANLKSILSNLGGTNLTLTHDATNGIVLNHDASGATAGSYGDSGAQTPAYGGTFKVPYVTIDAQGHVTGISEHTVKIPASDNTDTKVTNTLSTTTKFYVTGTSSNSTNTGGQYFDTGVYVSATAGELVADKFTGALNGNANTATKFASSQSITLSGDVSGSASSQAGWSITTAIGTGKVTNAMLAGSIANGKLANSSITIAGNSVSLGGSLAASTLVNSLGLSKAMSFRGITTTALTDGTTTNPITMSDGNLTAAAGDVVIYDQYEFVWTGSAWERLGGDSSYKISQSAVAKPSAATNKWVSAIGQNANGEISVDYGTLVTTGTWSGNAGTATKFASNQSVALTGDVTGSASSQAGWSISTTLANSGVSSGNYGPSSNATLTVGGTFSVPYFTVDAKGRLTAASTRTMTMPSTYTPSAHNHSEIVTIGDQRNVATTPNTYSNKISFQGLKSNSQINSPSTDTYSYIVGLRGWSDSSGGHTHELAFNNSGVYWRKGGTEWENWYRILTSGNSYAANTSTISLAWNTETTIATINGTAIKIKIPANPNTNTTYTIATGDSNGQIKVTPSSGSAYNVAVKGLGSAAYTASTAYATSGHTHTTSISQTGTATVNLSANTVYTLTAGGTSVVFKTPADTTTNYYHTTGSWSGLTYTATANGGAGALAFTIPVGTTATTVAAGNHTHSIYVLKEGDTMTGDLIVAKAATTQITVRDTSNNNLEARLQIGSGHQNHGLYSNGYAPSASTFTADAKWIIYRDSSGDATTQLKLYGAVWNDYADFRKTNSNVSPGQCVIDCDNGSLEITSKRLMPGAQIVSDTFGFSLGKTEECQTPLAVAGRVLAIPYRDRSEYHAGMAVCSAPNGTIDIMSREEIMMYPDCIIGIVSEIPEYATWGENGQVQVNGRIWIKVR